MAAVVSSDGGRLNHLNLLRRLRSRSSGAGVPGIAEPRVVCLASIRIPQERVAAALETLAGADPKLRQFTHGRATAPDRRVRLRDALRATGQWADRSPHDLGVVVTAVSGTTAQLQETWTQMAHTVAAGSYLQISRERYLAFTDDGVELRLGMHPDAERLSRESVPGDFGAA